MCIFCDKTIPILHIYIPNKDNSEEYFCRIRYDHDCEDRNEIDIELGINNNKENNVNGEWSYSVNTNYCPFCGKKQKNQINNAIERLDKIENNLYLMTKCAFKELSAVLLYDYEYKQLVLKIFKNTNLIAHNVIPIKYDINSGKEL